MKIKTCGIEKKAVIKESLWWLPKVYMAIKKANFDFNMCVESLKGHLYFFYSSHFLRIIKKQEGLSNVSSGLRDVNFYAAWFPHSKGGEGKVFNFRVVRHKLSKKKKKITSLSCGGSCWRSCFTRYRSPTLLTYGTLSSGTAEKYKWT